MHWGDECYYWSITEDNTNVSTWLKPRFNVDTKHTFAIAVSMV